MRHLALVSLTFFSATVMSASHSSAQDYEAMAKWTEAKVIHYRVVGEFSGNLRIFLGGKNLPSPVTDRVEIEFDWNQQENKLVRPPVIKNFPSKAGPILPDLGCPASKVSGEFEFFTMLSLKDQPEAMRMTAPGLVMESRRDHPGGEGPLLPASSSQSCGAAWEKVAAKSVTTSQVLSVPLAMMVAMGKMGGANVTADGKSWVDKFGPGTANEGWTWTFTPTIGK